MATPKQSTFELTGADGDPLRGDVRAVADGTARPAVVICHGFKGFKDWGFFPHLADRLARGGVSAVSFNFSGSGVGAEGDRFTEPERFGHATFGNDLRDLATVVAAVEDGALPGLGVAPAGIGLFGHSRGGGVSVLYSAENAGIRSLVTWSAIASGRRWGPETIRQWRRDGKLDVTNQRTGEVLPLFPDVLDELDADTEGRLDIEAAANRVRVPWLIVHGEADETVSIRDAQQLHHANEERAELMIVRHGAHTFGARHPWAGTMPELDQAMDATVGWFLRTLF
ncbi:MAG: lysophospholipase [Gemmatimonadota bacterium]|nr:lysophospholipase [Gemmatimonadota bacterium]MDH4349677.1 lysophospholipase [Gemmatimonadota bacterium]MDH5196979.1 lysophospholipase [Gemmatimonadota bacterium]